ncbi:hypothetical protein GQX73_g10386 [Xylaria multiplex]|uniref:Transcription factor domain-containing protein n=1 Tax=Xylaria multiplex TaxID=323545 RepID=A0A7C8MFG6_9PEZI|nr:hypothetical protein GQX73_g10386 [Xylaria multiplex]
MKSQHYEPSDYVEMFLLAFVFLVVAAYAYTEIKTWHMFGFKHTMDKLEHDTSDHKVIRTRLYSRVLQVMGPDHLKALYPYLLTRLGGKLDELFSHGKTSKDGISLPIAQTARQAASSLMSLMFFGETLSTNDEFSNALLCYPQDMVKCMAAFQVVPSFLSPLVHAIITKRGRSMSVIQSCLFERLNSQPSTWEESGGTKQQTILYDMANLAKGSDYWNASLLAQSLLGIWFAASHQPWMNLHFIILEVSARKDWQAALRQKLEQASPLDYKRLEQLPLLDSFIKETVRLNPLDTLAIRRKALESYTFSDNSISVPAGATVCVSAYDQMHSPGVYHEPYSFDPSRYIAGAGGVPSKFTDVSEYFPIWGYVEQSVTRSNPASPPDPVMQEVPQQVFDLGHLALLHHLENDLMKPPNFYLVPDEKDARNLLRMIVTCACSTPYLMDALLAFAALHLSVLASDVTSQHHYRHQAMHLHTRALSLYNAACPEITEQNCTALFLYSSFIGMHMLHDTVTSQTDLLELLDKFIQFAGLHRGVGIVTSRAWPIIRGSELSSIVDQIEAADKLEQPPQNICDHLFSLLRTAVDRLGPSSFQACHNAVQSLWLVCNHYSLLPFPINRHVVLAWPVHISTDYLQMLRERQPEALVIMAYWAVLLHYQRDFWVFGHGGRFLIEVISKYLGPSWDKWMALPRDVINADPI